MAQITSYASLQANIADWLNRTDLTAAIPTFIQLAESSIKRRLKTRHKTRYEFDTEADVGSYTMPTANAGAYAIVVTAPAGDEGGIDMVAPQHLWANRRLNKGITDRPVMGCIIGDTLLLSPLPDGAYTMELIYEGFSVLSDVNTTNYVLDDYPDLYLCGALLEAEPYLHNDQRIQVWERKYEKALKELELAQDRAEFPNTPVAKSPGNLAPINTHLIGR